MVYIIVQLILPNVVKQCLYTIYPNQSEGQQLTHTTGGGTLPSSSKRCTDQSHRHQYTSVGLPEDFSKGKTILMKMIC